jgi:hypothetical protein
MTERPVHNWKQSRYGDEMGFARRPPDSGAPVARPDAFDDYAGQWIAVKAGRVVAAANTSSELAFALHNLGSRDAAGAVMRYVAPPSSVVMVGLG